MFIESPSTVVGTPGTPTASIPPIEILNSFVPSGSELFTISIAPTSIVVVDGLKSNELLIAMSFVSE